MRNKYSFECLYLDEDNRELLEEYCVRNRYVENFFYGDKLNEHDIALYNLRPLTGIKKLLILLTLFEKIDSNESILDLSQLTDSGIIDEDAHISAKEDPRLEWKAHCINDPQYIAAYKIAMEIMELRKNEIIKKFVDTSLYHSMLCRAPSGRLLSFDKDYSEIIRNSEHYGNQNPNTIFTNIACTTDNLVRGIYYSLTENMTVGSGILQIPSKPSVTSDIDAIYYTIRTQLPNEVNILPMPQTFSDVEDMRKSTSLKSFRSVLKEWYHYIDKGDLDLAVKVKSDVVRANKALIHLKKYREFARSPYVRIFNLIGGEIPRLSTVLNILGFVASFVEDAIQRKNEWVLMPKL